jgi:hypothetical protein
MMYRTIEIQGVIGQKVLNLMAPYGLTCVGINIERFPTSDGGGDSKRKVPMRRDEKEFVPMFTDDTALMTAYVASNGTPSTQSILSSCGGVYTEYVPIRVVMSSPMQSASAAYLLSTLSTALHQFGEITGSSYDNYEVSEMEGLGWNPDGVAFYIDLNALCVSTDPNCVPPDCNVRNLICISEPFKSHT